MLSTLRSGRSVCSWASVTKLSKFQPRLVCVHNFGRVSSTGRRAGQQILKRYSANEAKTTVRAVPVESTRAGLTGIHIHILIIHVAIHYAVATAPQRGGGHYIVAYTSTRDCGQDLDPSNFRA